jgi:hypothetical protein
MRYLSLIFLIWSCHGPERTTVQALPAADVSDSSEYAWTLLTDSAAFRKSYNFQMFSIRDTLWVIQSDGGWFSTNGEDWKHTVLSNVIRNNGFLDYVWFRNALYGIGVLDGNIEHFQWSSSIHRTTDMRNWEKLADESELPRRFFYRPFVFGDKIWIIGGTDGKKIFNDIWNSQDGIHWTRMATDLPFGERQESQVVQLNGRLYLLNNDCWSSDDGLHWTLEAERFVPDTVFGYSAVVWDGKIWLLGCNRNNIFRSEILVSRDGKSWESRSAPWSPRGGMASCVHKGRIYMTGGKYGGFSGAPDFVYSNDVWTLGKR